MTSRETDTSRLPRIGRSVVALLPRLAPALLIVGTSLIVLAQFALARKATTQHFDILPLWLPTHCFLGSSIASGHVPAWNPFAMGGAPFAADPQSGWLYLPAMLLYAALPCGAALGWFIAIQPMIGGLGMYAFLRSEGAARAAAAVGGVTLALSVATSYTAISLPFSGAVAWSAVSLAALSRLWRATRWPPRLLWLLATAFAWGQLASAHMSHGLIVGSAAMLVFVAARLVGDAKTGAKRLRDGLLVLLLLVAALPIVNLAILLPRLEYIHSSSLANGYQGVRTAAAELRSGPPPKPLTGSTGAPKVRWPIGLALTPGAYVGAAAVALFAAGPWSRRHRGVAVAFMVYGLGCYLLSLRVVAEALAPHVRGFQLGDIYLHAPARLRFGVVIAAPVLAGLGADAWREKRPPLQRVLMVLPALVAFAALPTLLGYRWNGQWIPLGGAVLGGTVLALSALRPRVLVLLPVVLGVELTVNGLAGQAGLVHPKKPPRGLSIQALGAVRAPNIDIDAYLHPDAFVRTIRSQVPGRYLALLKHGFGRRGAGGYTRGHGYLTLTRPQYWPLLANQRSMLFGLEDVGGSDNPVQLLRYWSFVRTVDSEPLLYNAAFLTPPSASTLDLLQVEWLIAPADKPSPVKGVVAVAREGPWALYHVKDAAPRASVLTRWTVVAGRQAALQAVADPTFDPRKQAVLETAPRFAPPEAAVSPDVPSNATFTWRGNQEAIVRASSPRPAILVVRNTYAPGWKAVVDGRPVDVQPVDFLEQGVPIPPGRHVVRLAYSDPAIGQGLVGSAAAVAVLLCLALWRGVATATRHGLQLATGITRTRGSDARTKSHPRKASARSLDV